MKKISIITIVKNNKKGIKKTIKSVLGQNIFSDVEYIIIDSNSNDGTSNIISKFKKKLTYIREKDKNIYEGLNKGIKKAKGRYIGLLHSGDEFKHNFSLSDALKKIKDYKLDAASFSLIYQNKQTIKRYWKAPKKKITKYTFFKIAHPTLILKNKIYQKLMYNTNYSISGDADWLIRLLNNNYLKFKSFDIVLQICQYGGVSTNKKFLLKKVIEDLEILFRNFGLLFLILYINKLLVKIPSFFTKK